MTKVTKSWRIMARPTVVYNRANCIGLPCFLQYCVRCSGVERMFRAEAGTHAGRVVLRVVRRPGSVLAQRQEQVSPARWRLGRLYRHLQ